MAARKFLSGLDLASQQIKHLADGSAADDAATWGQVQAFLAGLAWKPSVRAASTANVNLASAPASIDGVALAANDRVLLKNQTTGSENGIYVYAATGSALTRATDMDTAAETSAATVLVTEGTANKDTAWTQTADGVNLGVTTLTFVQFGASGSTYTAGNGLALAASQFSIKLPGSGVVGLVVDGTGIYIDTSVVVRKFAVDVGDGASTAVTVTHNLNTRDVVVGLYDKTSNAEVETDVVHATVNTLTLNFAVAPTAAQYRCVVHA